MMQHKIPLHLETEDPFLWSLTGRQLFIIALGVGTGYLAFSDITMQVTPFSLILGVILWSLFTIASVLIAFIRRQQKNLEAWMLIWLLYELRPRYHIWRPLMEENEQYQSIDKKEHHEHNEQGKSERW